MPSTSLAHFRLLSSGLIGGYKGFAGTVLTASICMCLVGRGKIFTRNISNKTRNNNAL